jgi:hypothetical protein
MEILLDWDYDGVIFLNFSLSNWNTFHCLGYENSFDTFFTCMHIFHAWSSTIRVYIQFSLGRHLDGAAFDLSGPTRPPLLMRTELDLHSWLRLRYPVKLIVRNEDMSVSLFRRSSNREVRLCYENLEGPSGHIPNMRYGNFIRLGLLWGYFFLNFSLGNWNIFHWLGY